MTATITLHPDFPEAGGAADTAVWHSDPACGFAAAGESSDLTEGEPCRFCVGGDTYRPIPGLVGIGGTEEVEGNYRGDRRPADPNAPKLTPAERIARTAAWLTALGRKVETCDIDHTNARAAQDWLRAYNGDFAFLTDLKAKARRLTDGQAKGVLNCWRAEILRGGRAASPPVVSVPEAGPAPAIAPEIEALLP